MIVWVQVPLEVLQQLLKGVEKYRLTRLFRQSAINPLAGIGRQARLRI